MLGDPRTRRLHLTVLALGPAVAAVLVSRHLHGHGGHLGSLGHLRPRLRDRSDLGLAGLAARHFIDHVPIAPSLLGICAGLVAGAAWLLGELASVDAVSQFAFVGMLVGFVWAVMGTRWCAPMLSRSASCSSWCRSASSSSRP
jgi:hypothetical protein